MIFSNNVFKKLIKITKSFCDWVCEWRFLGYEEWNLCWLMKSLALHAEHWVSPVHLRSLEQNPSVRPNPLVRSMDLIQQLKQIKSYWVFFFFIQFFGTPIHHCKHSLGLEFLPFNYRNSNSLWGANLEAFITLTFRCWPNHEMATFFF